MQILGRGRRWYSKESKGTLGPHLPSAKPQNSEEQLENSLERDSSLAVQLTEFMHENEVCSLRN